MQNLHRRFEWHYIGQIYGGDFAKFWGILRIYELYGSKSALNSTILVLIRLYISPKLDFIWFCFTISYVLCQVIMIKIFWSRFLDLCWVHAHKLVKRISPKCISEILENLEVWNGMQINSFKNGISNFLEVLS